MTDLEKDKILLLAHSIGKMARELQSTKRLLKEIADTPQTDCDTCKHYKLACELFSEICKYEPTTQTETENSNLTFENRTMRDCYNCKRYETEGECIECHYEPKDEPQTERHLPDYSYEADLGRRIMEQTERST